jgi:transcriptional repressor NrdR
MPRLIKRDRAREPFDEAKLRSGMVRALERRPVSIEAIEESIERINHRLQTMGEREIESAVVGGMVMEERRALDEVAYVRFASVYRRFQDVTEFQDEITRLREVTDEERRRNQLSLLPDEKK